MQLLRKTFPYLIIFILSAACESDDSPGEQGDQPSQQKTINLTVDGLARSFILYQPIGYNNAGKMPVLFIIHGGSGTPEGMMKIAGFKTIADREKVLLVYPAGTQKNWNDGRPTAPNQAGVDDVSFFDEMSRYLVLNYAADETRMFATGISNGGFMSSRLGCELSEKIAAIAVVAATMEALTIAPGCNPGRPVPAIYMHGTTDPLVPFTGGEMTASGTAGGTILSHFEAIEKWIAINSCSSTPVVTDLPDLANDGTTIKRRVFSGGTGGSEVVSYVILNGGHTWPQGYQYLSESIVGKTSQDINACEVIWDFFSRFQR